MKICIIGDSHIGSLQRSWGDIAKAYNKEGLQITFFGCPANGFKDLSLVERKLVANDQRLRNILAYTSAGQDCIDLCEYDLFIIYALEARPYYASESYYSDAVLKQSIKDTYDGCLSFKIVNLIRQAVNTKIYVSHIPLHAHKKDEIIEYDELLFSQYFEGISLANKLLFSLLNAELIPQPRKTISGNGRKTLFQYTEGSLRLNIRKGSTVREHPEGELAHMNDGFGGLWFQSFINSIRG